MGEKESPALSVRPPLSKKNSVEEEPIFARGVKGSGQKQGSRAQRGVLIFVSGAKNSQQKH